MPRTKPPPPKRRREKPTVEVVLDAAHPEGHRYLLWDKFRVGDTVEFTSSDPRRAYKKGRIESIWSSCQTRKHGAALRIQVGPRVFVIRSSKTCRVPAAEPAPASTGRKRLATTR
jgi:hypothetical protein